MPHLSTPLFNKIPIGVFFLASLVICSSVRAQKRDIDLGEISKKNNGNIRYVAIGSSLSAGVRDGGVYAYVHVKHGETKVKIRVIVE